MTRRTPTPAHTGRRRRGHTSTSAVPVGIASRLIIYSIIVTTSGVTTVRSNIVIVMTTTYTNTTTAAGRRHRLRRFVTCQEPGQDRLLLLV